MLTSTLEYRLYDERAGFPVLYRYPAIPKTEAAMRFACDYWVKEKHVYEVTSTAMEGDGGYVIYVKKADSEAAVPITDPVSWRGIRVEVREYKPGAVFYQVVRTREFDEPLDALLFLQCTYLDVDGKEWERTSAEVDEDRKVYVVYAKETRF